MEHNRFKKRSGLFNCLICGRAARDVNGANGNMQLCKHCDEISMTENGIGDGAYDTPEALAEAEAHIARLTAERDAIIAAKS